MTNNDKTAAKEKLQALQEKILAQKKELAELNEEKERWFQKRAEIGSEVASHIRLVKEKRNKRDALTQKVQEEKKERRNYSQEIRDKISEVKKLRAKRKEMRGKIDSKARPGQLKKEISKIEYKLQTEPMKYGEEKKLTKVLKEKKSAYEEFNDINKLSKTISALSKEIDELKKESDEVHEELQSKAEDSQEFHEKVVATSKKIDELKKEEDEAYKKFSELKDEYNKKRDALQALIDEANKLRKELGQAARNTKLHTKKKEEKILKEKSAEVEEKVKKRQKLTTEDLLAYQASD